MGKPFFNISLSITNENLTYKSVFNKLKTFLKYHATVGVHKEQGKIKVIRKYNKKTKSGKVINKIAGVSHRMTIAKLAYQNEFGATIKIKAKYGIKRRTVQKETTVGKINGRNYRISASLLERYYGKEKSSKQQGFLLMSKKGEFVMYKKPGSEIRIPSRSFLRKIVTEPNSTMVFKILSILDKLFKVGSGRARPAWVEIATLVREEVKKNIRNSSPNSGATIKAKGSNTPLSDEQDRIYKSIKYKLYKRGEKGDLDYHIQSNIKTIDKVLKAMDQIQKNKVTGYETKYVKRFLK